MNPSESHRELARFWGKACPQSPAPTPHRAGGIPLVQPGPMPTPSGSGTPTRLRPPVLSCQARLRLPQ
ncbi:hypothetical protein CH063_06581 [Colletotrichum higginsianum]|uniref:Uncharacterized protein n=1 Tax=Colletotrichum higginsianum (strain IMI 349063) TaxID=759273 RepID=H1V325_COLHI|nr:hypothetical protein CH063_06581 [Colletotrichum higginsianum]